MKKLEGLEAEVAHLKKDPTAKKDKSQYTKL